MGEELKYTAKRSEFKGHPLLALSSGDNEKYPFQFGLQKAKRIVACIEDIKKFVVDEDAKAQGAK
jgi:hypothetical protein